VGRPPPKRPQSGAGETAWIEEVLDLRVSPGYFQYLRHKLARIVPTR
jgi:hypothetical protein